MSRFEICVLSHVFNCQTLNPRCPALRCSLLFYFLLFYTVKFDIASIRYVFYIACCAEVTLAGPQM